MAKTKTKADEYKEIFVKLHKLQRKGADNLIMLLTKYVRGNVDYKSSYIELVAERTGVSPTGHTTTTNKDIMVPIVKEVIHIKDGLLPLDNDVNKAWDMFIEDYRNHKI